MNKLFFIALALTQNTIAISPEQREAIRKAISVVKVLSFSFIMFQPFLNYLVHDGHTPEDLYNMFHSHVSNPNDGHDHHEINMEELFF